MAVRSHELNCSLDLYICILNIPQFKMHFVHPLSTRTYVRMPDGQLFICVQQGGNGFSVCQVRGNYESNPFQFRQAKQKIDRMTSSPRLQTWKTTTTLVSSSTKYFDVKVTSGRDRQTGDALVSVEVMKHMVEAESVDDSSDSDSDSDAFEGYSAVASRHRNFTSSS